MNNDRISFSCDSCGQDYNTEVTNSGRSFSCNKCGVRLRVPATAKTQNRKKVLKKILFFSSSGFTYIGYLIISILCFILYVWSIIISYFMYGIIGAALTVLFPVVSQIFWFFRLWILTKNILNPYCLAFLVALVIILIMIPFIIIAAKTDES